MKKFLRPTTKMKKHDFFSSIHEFSRASFVARAQWRSQMIASSSKTCSWRGKSSPRLFVSLCAKNLVFVMKMNEKWRKNQKKRKNCIWKTQKRECFVRSTQWRLLYDVHRKWWDAKHNNQFYVYHLAILRRTEFRTDSVSSAAAVRSTFIVQNLWTTSLNQSTDTALSDDCVLWTFLFTHRVGKDLLLSSTSVQSSAFFVLFIRRKALSLSLYSILFQLNGNDADEGGKNSIEFSIACFCCCCSV